MIWSIFIDSFLKQTFFNVRKHTQTMPTIDNGIMHNICIQAITLPTKPLTCMNNLFTRHQFLNAIGFSDQMHKYTTFTDKLYSWFLNYENFVCCQALNASQKRM